MAEQRSQTAAQQRVIRVFVSSTFRDMQEEREELVKRVFPRLRKLCEQRGVTWGEVDLRWGITEDQAERGEVLPICLEEIRRCCPYFIGLLGERYGWVPDEYSQELIEQQPWLEEQLERSITELEILHGVLNDPAMADHAYVYFRDPAYVASLPSEVQAEYREVPTEEEIQRVGLEKARRRAEERRAKLEVLKERIRASGLPVREDYQDPVELGQLVLGDLTALVDRLFPKGEQPDPLDREAAEHEAFAGSRAGVYIGRQAYFDRLDAHARADGEPLVVLGKSGSGKSALLANWALRYREEHPEEMVLMHFIGASPYSADWRAMLRRIMGALQRQFDIQGEIPDEPDALRATFANWLYMAAARGRMVLILDALNQLEDREGAPDLIWLPPVIPDNVRLVLSTLPGRPLEAVEERGWPTLQVEPLDIDERRRLIREYLAQYTKALSPDRVARIAREPQAANPLYLRALLEELRAFGVHERLDQHIDHYLEARRIDVLYGKVLQRYEEDYERDRPGLVGEAMSLLWAARRGLAEAELLELLGSDGEPLPQAYWSPLYLTAEASLVSRAGLIGFSHDYLRQAARDRYLSTEEDRGAAHERLAHYFEFAPLPATVHPAGQEGREGIYFEADAPVAERVLDEAPWQLARAGQSRRLADFLLLLPVFRAACAQGREYEWMAYWQDVRRMLADAGAPAFDIPGHYLRAFWALSERSRTLLAGTLGQFLQRMGFPDAADRCFAYEHESLHPTAPAFLRAANLNDHAQVLAERGEHEAALDVYIQCERLLQTETSAPEKRRMLASVLMNQANTLRELGRLDGVEAMLQRSLTLMKETTGDDSAEVATVLQAFGNLFWAQHRYEKSLSFHRQAYEIRRRRLGSTHHDVGLSLANMANALVRMQRFYRGMESLDQALDIFQRTLGPDHPYGQQVQESLRQCQQLEERTAKPESGLGLVLLAVNTLPRSESPPTPPPKREPSTSPRSWSNRSSRTGTTWPHMTAPSLCS